MTRNGNFKRRVRTRAAKTGESYTSALSHIRAPQATSRTEPQADEPAGKSLRLAVAQTTVRLDPRDADAFRANGAEMRRLMRQARDAGARLLHFSEGTICFPHKRILSEIGPAEIGASDWKPLPMGGSARGAGGDERARKEAETLDGLRRTPPADPAAPAA